MRNDVCAICGGALTRTLLTINAPDRFELRCGVSLEGYARHWTECAVCGAVSNELPEDSRKKLASMRGAYYEVDFANSDIGEKYRKVMSLPPEQSDNWWRVARIQSFCARWLTPGTRHRVLDIGAGTGVFLSRFLDAAKTPWDAVAIEPDPLAAAHLMSLRRFTTLQVMYQGQPELRNFRLVTLNKVLEHIDEPVALLRAVAGSLAPGRSLLYVELPDKLTIGRRPPDDNILGPLHCHLYHPGSVERLFRESGFEPLCIERVVEPSGKITIFGIACLPQGLLDL